MAGRPIRLGPFARRPRVWSAFVAAALSLLLLIGSPPAAQAEPGDFSVPGAPTAVSATAGDGMATVSFTAPADSGGGPIYDYTVTSGGFTAQCGTASPCQVYGLLNGVPYTFTVHATNAYGNGPESGATNSVTPSTIPDAPYMDTTTAGNKEVSVSFFSSQFGDGGSPITGYTVTASPGNHTKTCPGSPCVVTGLTNGTNYVFTVDATNANGTSVESAPAQATPAGLPGAPTGVSAVAGNGEATVSWTPPADDGGGNMIMNYTVTSSPGGMVVNCPNSPCTELGLMNDQPYTFRVHATNQLGDSPESAASAAVTPTAPQAPSAPTQVTAVAGDGVASVAWTTPGSDGGSPIYSYTVTAVGGVATLCQGSPCQINGLMNGFSYTFTVHASNANGDSPESGASNSVTPSTVPDTPYIASADAGTGRCR